MYVMQNILSARHFSIRNMFWPKRSPNLMDALRARVSQTRPPVLEALKHYHRQLQKHFDAACWPSILRNLKELKSPKNLFNLSRSYFSNRTALLCGNTMKTEKPVTMGVPSNFLWRLRVLEYTLQLAA
jgi:hypothetical protein